MIPHEVCISSQICQLCQLSLETNADDHPPSQIDLASPELSILMTPFDLKRIASYANNMLDYHVILDLLPMAANLYFEKRLGSEVRLSAVQSSILLAIGLQRKTIEEVEVSTTPRSCHIRKCGDLTMEISLFLSFSSLFPLASFPFIFLIPDGTAASCLTGSGPLHKDYPKD